MGFCLAGSAQTGAGDKVTGGPVGKVDARSPLNLAVLATPGGIDRFGGNYDMLNDGVVVTEPGNPAERRAKPRRFSTWVEYDWRQPITTDKIAVFWWDHTGTVPLPSAYRLTYWDGHAFRPVKDPSGLGLVNGAYNETTFKAVRTTKLRLDMDSADRWVAAVLEWQVFAPPGAPPVAPVVAAGEDRDVMLDGKTYLSGKIRTAGAAATCRWSMDMGPGEVRFSQPDSPRSVASFSAPGIYTLRLTARQGKLAASSTVSVKVVLPPPAKRLDVVYTTRYKIDNRLWNDRFKAIITHWIPFCISQIECDTLKTGQGGLDNFIEAAKALKGLPHRQHKGYVFSNAWVYQTVEAMCEALMVDPGGDAAIIAAQEKMKAALERWIPIILAAQEPDGYLQTAWTLRDTSKWHRRWSPEGRGNHEGYTAGYFIESAINHYTLTEGRDRRLYDAAKRLADCWVAHLGPGKQAWFDGHQEMEQALVRFGRFVNDMEGQGHGDAYIRLAKFLLDCRGGGDEYDQSQAPVQEQYEAVGHAVRATYTYSGMADIAAEMHDVDYQSAVMSLWDDMVNRKYYVTGGIGSGETSEGFGPDYSLRNDAYCESCSSCGLIFFEYKMNLAYHDAKYADLYEETLYNALLGSLNLAGTDFYYTNALATEQPRYAWHSCPCCVGNIPRTLLMMPTWTYVRGEDGIYVNLFVGSTMQVGKVAGTPLQLVQRTEYPWSPNVSIEVDPEQEATFTVYVRVPNRATSELYKESPAVSGLEEVAVNGQRVTPVVERGYAEIRRAWKKGDRIEFRLPMTIQKIVADPRVAADSGRLALRYGPLLYNVETADNGSVDRRIGSAPLRLEWKDGLLDGVMAIVGQWADGTPLVAIPNYARMNRVPPTPTPKPDYRLVPATGNQPPEYQPKTPVSIVWIKD